MKTSPQLSTFHFVLGSSHRMRNGTSGNQAMENGDGDDYLLDFDFTMRGLFSGIFGG